MASTFDRIHHVGIVVRSIEDSEAWYVENLGFERLYAYGWLGVQAVFIGRGNLKVELFQNVQATAMTEDRQVAETNLRIGGINHFAIQVEDLDQAISDLKHKGVVVISPPKTVPNSGGDRFAFIHDNERMLVELFQCAGSSLDKRQTTDGERSTASG